MIIDVFVSTMVRVWDVRCGNGNFTPCHSPENLMSDLAFSADILHLQTDIWRR